MPFVTQELHDAFKGHAKSREAYFELPTQAQQQESARQELQASAAAAQQALKQAHRARAEAQSEMLQDKAETGDPSVIWSLIKTLRKAKASPKMPLQAFKDLQGNIVPAPETRAEAWRDVFANEFSYQVKTFTRPELQTLLRQRIAEAHTAKALRPAPRMADQRVTWRWCSRSCSPLSVPGVIPGC